MPPGQTFPEAYRPELGQEADDKFTSSIYTDSTFTRLTDTYQFYIGKTTAYVREQSAKGILPKLLTFYTDIGDDPWSDADHPAALIMMITFERLGVSNLLDITTTGHNRVHNAQLTKGFVKSLGIEHIPVVPGEAEYDPADSKAKEAYELSKNQDVAKWRKDYSIERDFPSIPGDIKNGTYQELASNINREAQSQNRKITRIVTTGHQTFKNLMLKPEYLASTSQIIFQGGWNLKYDSEELLKKIKENSIPASCFSRESAIKCAIRPKFTEELAKTGHPVADFLNKLFKKIDARQFHGTLRKETQFSENFNTKFYLEKKTILMPAQQEEVRDYFVDNYGKSKVDDVTDEGYERYEDDFMEKVEPYVKLLPYDELAALGALDEELLIRLGILIPGQNNLYPPLGDNYRLDGKSSRTLGINYDKAREAIEAFIAFSFLRNEDGTFVSGSSD